MATYPATLRGRSSPWRKQLEDEATGDVGGSGVAEVSGGVHQNDGGRADAVSGGVSNSSTDRAGGGVLRQSYWGQES